MAARCVVSHSAPAWTACSARFTDGSGAIPIGACASCSPSRKSKATAGATSSAPRRLTPDPLLRRLYLAHAIDELHHSDLFRDRGAALLQAHHARSGGAPATNVLPGGHGLDDLCVVDEPDDRLLAFLHVAEKAAAGRFAIYREIVDDDPPTRAIFDEILRDEVFHMNYTYRQLQRVSPKSYRRYVWWARASRLWKRYLRLAAVVAGLFGRIMFTLMYFVLLPPFAWLAKRAERREPAGWTPVPAGRDDSPTSQY